MGMYTRFNVFVGEIEGDDFTGVSYYIDGYNPIKNDPDGGWELVTMVDADRIVDKKFAALYDTAEVIANELSVRTEKFPVASFIPERYDVDENGLFVDLKNTPTTLDFRVLSDGERTQLSRHLIGFLKTEE